MKDMKKDFDFNRIGKRMPYGIPKDFLEDMERNVLEEIRKKPVVCHPVRRFMWLRTVAGSVAVAASITLIFILWPFHTERHDDAGMAQVEQAFANLSGEDRTYMLMIYQEDIFINE